MKTFICSMLAIFLFVQPVGASNIDDADQALKNAVESVVTLLRDKSLDADVRRNKVMGHIKSIFDFKLMAKLTLGKKLWPRFNKKQKRRFVELFTRQLENTYYGKTEFFSDEKIVYETPKLKKRKVHILTKVFSKDDKIEVLYKLYNRKGNWKIYDAEIQGVSIINSFRSQYKQFLIKGTVDALLKKLSKKDKA